MIPNDKSNLGWRILAELFLDEDEQRKIVKGSLSGKPIVELLSSQFVERQMRAIKLARAVRSQDATGEAVQDELRELVGENFANHVLQSLAQAEPPVAALDKKLPTILFTSFKGCKGLSAGHVFIVGVHDAGMPNDNNKIDAVEVPQFIVALTRTRKQCHILSNDWVHAPHGKKGWIDRFKASLFVEWLPKDLVEDRGQLRAKDLK